MKAIKIDITSPEATTLQLFYKTRIFQFYNETNSIRKQLTAGRYIAIFLLPDQGIKGRLRIDPGSHAGNYIIHKTEIGF